MSGFIGFRSFENRSDASSAAAELLTQQLNARLSNHPQNQASLVVSGGSTPGPCFDQLSVAQLDWPRINVLPSDERYVPGTHADSNERLIRTRLLHGRAGQGRFLPFYRDGVKAAQAPELIDTDLQELGLPFSVVLLGMGEDGHFASLFPDFSGLDEALNPENKTRCIMVQTAGSSHLRISLTLSALLNSVSIVLLIFGDAKRDVFDVAMKGGSHYPIESLLQHASTPLTVFWAP